MEEALSKTNFGKIGPLTKRELEILTLLDENRSYQEIAQNLAVALTTVKGYIQQINMKLGVESRRQAVDKARKIGLLSDNLALSLPSRIPTTCRYL
jgi:ATP/maltotriose-dependent transcriptional regulator MalT